METLMLDAFERFRAAVARHQPLHETVHSDHAEVLLAADDILRARLALYRCLQGRVGLRRTTSAFSSPPTGGCSLNETIASYPTRVDGKKRHQ